MRIDFCSFCAKKTLWWKCGFHWGFCVSERGEVWLGCGIWCGKAGQQTGSFAL